MVLRISQIFFIVSALLMFNSVHAGKYIYDESMGSFQKKSKKQEYRVKVVKRKKKLKRTPVEKPLDLRLAQFSEKQNEIENLDLWLVQFEKDTNAELGELYAAPLADQARLDYKIRLNFLHQKLDGLKNEMVRPKSDRHFWRRSPTDHMFRAQRENYDVKLRWYEELYNNALTPHIKIAIDKVVGFLVQLNLRNEQERDELATFAADDALSMVPLAELQRRISRAHPFIESLWQTVDLLEIQNLEQPPQALEEQTYEHICTNYERILEAHQQNYDAINALIERANFQQAALRVLAEREQQQIEHIENEGAVDFNNLQQDPAAREVWGQAADAAVADPVFAVRAITAIGRGVTAPIRLGAAGIKKGYDEAKKSYDAHKDERRRIRERHRTYCARAENSFEQFVPENSSAEVRDIYQRSFARFTHRKYSYSDIDFEESASLDAMLKVEQISLIERLREALDKIPHNQDLSLEAREKIIRATKQSLENVMREPKQSRAFQNDPKNIQERICRKEAVKVERAAARKTRQQQKLDRKAEEEKRQKEEAKEQSQARREKQERRRQNLALEQQRKAKAHALYKIIKEELRNKRHKLDEQKSLDDEVDAVLMDLLLSNAFDKDYVSIFGRRTLEELVAFLGKPSYENFWQAVNEGYRQPVEKLLKQRKAFQRRSVNKERNLQALRILVKEIQRKSDAEQNAQELLIIMFAEALEQNERKSHQHVFGRDNLVDFLESHDSFDNVLSALNERFEKKVVQFQANRDQQLLVEAAKSGLSRKPPTKFRERVFKNVQAELDAIDAQFAVEVSVTRREEEDSPDSGRVRLACRELLACQSDFEQRILDYQKEAGYEHNDDDDTSAQSDDEEDNDADKVMELTEENALADFKKWYVSFPKSIATVIHITNECILCFLPLDYDLVFSSKDSVNLQPGLLLQQPKVGTHKLSSCGHLLCDKCVRNLEARSKKIKNSVKSGEIFLSPYTCPWCRKNVPCDELNEKEFIKAFGQRVHSNISN